MKKGRIFTRKNGFEKMLKKLIYTGFWSALLLYATFPGLFDGSLSFPFQEKLGIDTEVVDAKIYNGLKAYIRLYVITMSIFLFDIIYNFIKGPRTYGALIIVGVIAFLLCLVFSLSYGGAWLFVLGWIILTSMKFFTTETISNEMIYNTISED